MGRTYWSFLIRSCECWQGITFTVRLSRNCDTDCGGEGVALYEVSSGDRRLKFYEIRDTSGKER